MRSCVKSCDKCEKIRQCKKPCAELKDELNQVTITKRDTLVGHPHSKKAKFVQISDELDISEIDEYYKQTRDIK